MILNDKSKVIIIGASSGIGKSLAIHYASMNVKVGIAARREDKLNEIKSLYPSNIYSKKIDITSQDAFSLLSELIEEMGGMDMLIFASGVGHSNKKLDIKIEQEIIEVNNKGFLNIIIPTFHYFTNKSKVDKGLKKIVVLSSVASIKGLGASPAYSASKRFMTTYCESLQQIAIWNNSNIKFTLILPGFIDTDFIKGHNYPFTMPLDYAVKKIILAIEKNKFRAIIDWKWTIIVFIWSHFPLKFWESKRIAKLILDNKK